MDNVAGLIRARRRQDLVFNAVGIACTSVGVLTLAILFVNLAQIGGPRFRPRTDAEIAAGKTKADKTRLPFVQNLDSRRPERAGIRTAIVGTLAIALVTFLSAVPLGVAAAVYLEEYARKNWFTNLIEVNISNLAGVPSITYGLMALWVFGAVFGVAETSSILAGGLTLALLILPVIIVATREALRAIPSSIREAAYASGATKWQLIRFHLLPYSLGGIATGTIIAMSRAVGETAPLIVVGAAAYVATLPDSPLTSVPPFLSFRWLWSDYTVLPLQMYNWMRNSNPGFQANAAAAGLVLIAFTLSMNAVAIVVRYRVRQKLKW
jgi:phosphate transport system permease protein